jgi:hypothetical protein
MPYECNVSDHPDYVEGCEDGIAWEHAKRSGDTIPLPTDPSSEWQAGFRDGRSTYWGR